MKAVQMMMMMRKAEKRVYGYLYNWYVVDSIAATGWRLPTRTETINMFISIGGVFSEGAYLTVAGKLKSTRTAPTEHPRWDAPNTGALNSYAYNGLPAGWRRGSTGAFEFLGQFLYQWLGTADGETKGYLIANISSTTFEAQIGSQSKLIGCTIRLVRDATIQEMDDDYEAFIPEQTIVEDLYVGNDNTKYKGIRIGGLIWLAENLRETKYQNGDPIPNVTDATEWSELTTGARCAYDNDESYV